MPTSSGCSEAFSRAVREFYELTRGLSHEDLTRAELAALRILLRDLIDLHRERRLPRANPPQG